MGGVSSKSEEDKALQLCSERKKIVRQALDGRIFLAANHIAYVEALKIAGNDLRKFVEWENPFESPSPAPTRFHTNHMKCRGTLSMKVEERPKMTPSEDEEQSYTSHGRAVSHESDDEFDEPHTDTLIRSFENVNRSTDNSSSEARFMNRESNLSNLPSSTHPSSGGVNEVAPKDFNSSLKDIELLFIKASDSGREVSQMLEANKFDSHPIFPATEEPPQTSVEYLTWHHATSSHSSTSRDPHSANSTDAEDFSNRLVDNFCKNSSGSHTSTLDQLFAWEKKLYDEVKACAMVRHIYDERCKVLRQLESKGETSGRIDNVRAVVKDLHSRIGVAIYRINSISRKIEDLRDKELQPQLEELIQGLRRMWEAMLDCHKLQHQIISVSHPPGTINISTINSESRRETLIRLENELISLSSIFTEWTAAQKTYVEAINMWLMKCVFLEEKSSRRWRRHPLPVRKYGPPIYVICGVWLDMFESLPTKDVVDAMKALASEVARSLPPREKARAKGAGDGGDPVGSTTSLSGDHFHTSLAVLLGQLSRFADSSVKMYAHLQKATQDAKSSYARQ